MLRGALFSWKSDGTSYLNKCNQRLLTGTREVASWLGKAHGTA